MRPVYIIISIMLTANGFLPGGNDATIKHNTQITHHAQTNHSTQNYTHNKRRITEHKQNANEITATFIQVNRRMTML
jgi:hypothetical protein